AGGGGADAADGPGRGPGDRGRPRDRRGVARAHPVLRRSRQAAGAARAATRAGCRARRARRLLRRAGDLRRGAGELRAGARGDLRDRALLPAGGDLRGGAGDRHGPGLRADGRRLLKEPGTAGARATGRTRWPTRHARTAHMRPGRPADRRRSRLAMEQGAPAAVVIATGLTAASWIAFHRNGLVVEAARGRSVRGAPAYVENLQTRIGIGLAGGTVRPSDGRCIPDGL